MTKLTLPTDSDERKEIPLMSGCMNYFPAALMEIAKISVKGDRKHNPQNAGNPPFHARGKSMDHGDCIIRHTMDIEDIKAQMNRGPYPPTDAEKAQVIEEAAYRAWRSCAELQELCERYAGAPLAPAARLPAVLTAQAIPTRAAVPFKFPELSGPAGGLLGARSVDYGDMLDAEAKEKRTVAAMRARVSGDDAAGAAMAEPFVRD